MRRRGAYPIPLRRGGSILPFSDDFNRGDGAIGGEWAGATWTVDTNQVKNTPSLGSELITNGDFANWTGDDPDNWTVAESLPNAEVSEVGAGQGHGGAGTGLCNLYRNGGGNDFNPNLVVGAFTVGQWYLITVDVDTFTTIGEFLIRDTSAGLVAEITSTGSKVATGRAAHTTLRFGCGLDPTDVTIDDISVKQLTLSSLFATRDFQVADVSIEVETTLTEEITHAGVIMNLDDASTPANFVIGYHDGSRARLVKCVAGTYTSVISAVAVYGAGRVVKVVKSGTSYSLYYNAVQVGTTQTVSDAGIVDNTIHGMFSTHSTNRLDNFAVEAN